MESVLFSKRQTFAGASKREKLAHGVEKWQNAGKSVSGPFSGHHMYLNDSMSMVHASLYASMLIFMV